MRDSRLARAHEVARPPLLAGPLYEPLDFIFVRTPSLPVEAYLSLSTRSGNDHADYRAQLAATDADVCEPALSLARDARVRRALAVGSSALADALERAERSGLSRRDAERLRAKLLRYLIRMSTRPTPYGLFAGVALGRWGEATDLSLATTCARIRARPDMAWLMAFVFDLESQAAIRRHLRLQANPAAMIRGDRVVLPERAPSGQPSPEGGVSLRATGVVKRALSLAREPVVHEALVAHLLETTPGATTEKVERLLDELWQQTLLLTDLRPPLTTDDPARYVAQRLATIPGAGNARMQLECILEAAAAWDNLPPDEAATAYRKLVEQANAVNRAAEDTPLQVDGAHALTGDRLARSVGEEVARAAEILLRLTPLPQGLPYLAAYRQAFIARYGHHREVPLLELLDAELGLGPPSMHGPANGGAIPPAKASQRARTLLDLACAALRDRQLAVDLDASTLDRLETWTPAYDTAPTSLDLNVFVAAPSTAALDAGKFLVVIGPNLGALAAGRNLGRFADLLAPEAPAALVRAAGAEQAHAPDKLWAELTYLPPRFRSANVTVRPAVRSHEIALGVTPGVPASEVIPLDGLVVGVRSSRFYVRWPAAGRDVIVCAGHMLNNANAPVAGRFLIDASRDGIAVLSTFDWGAVEHFPFLPRVQAGRIVLRLAQWRINKGDLALDPPAAFRDSLGAWRRQWGVPQHVNLSVGDNRLILDLDDDNQANELRTELQNLQDGQYIVLQEVLPTFDQLWTRGADGRYVTEFVVSLVLRGGSGGAVTRAEVPAEAVAPTGPVTHPRSATVGPSMHVSPSNRLRPPGSDWLFMKIYCPRSFEDDLIAGPVRTFSENALAAGLTDEWFFIRYSDPDPHIRLRFRGVPDRLTRGLLPHVCTWGNELIEDGLCLKFSFDTYDQEVERYGGTAGMAVAESAFAADSRTVAELLWLIQEKQLQIDRTTLAILTADDLLTGLGLDEATRLRWYKAQATTWNEVGQEYRQRKVQLRSLLGEPRPLRAEPGGADADRTLAARRAALAPLAVRLKDLATRGELTQTLDALYGSFIHLHVNRMSGADAATERHLLGLLLRTRESLYRAPVVGT